MNSQYQKSDYGVFGNTGSWCEDYVLPKSKQRSSIRIATFNVWFGDLAWQGRQDALFSLLKKNDVDIIGFQEVTPRFLERMLKIPWLQERYAISDNRGTSLGSYGVLFLTSLPISDMFLVDLPTRMGRRLLCADITINKSVLRVGVVHLESRRPEGIMRGSQLDIIFPILNEVPQSLLMGDFNFCHTNDAEQERLPESYLDIWPTLHPNEAGWTEDTTVNHMRYDQTLREKHARYDRIILSKRGPWQPESIRLIGTEAISENRSRIFPSDHFGLLAELVNHP